MKARTARTTTSQVISTLLVPYEMAKVELSFRNRRRCHRRIALDQLLLAERKLAQALAGRGKDRIVERRGHGRYSRFAGSGGQGLLVCDEMHMRFQRRFIHAGYQVIIEITLLDASIGGRDFSQ